MKSVSEGDREPILHRFLGTEMVVHGILLYSLLCQRLYLAAV